MPTKLPDKQPAENETPAHPSNPFLVILGLVILLVSSLFSPMLFVGEQDKVYYGVAAMLTWAMLAALVKGLGFVPENALLKAIFSIQAVMAGLVAAVILRSF